MIGPHQPIFDGDLTRDQVDEPAMDEVGRDPARALMLQHQRFALDARQPANARADRAARAQPLGLAHLGQAGIFQRLARRIDAEDDERIDLPLDLVVNAQIGVESPFMVLGFHFAGNAAGIIARVEPRDRAGARSRCEDIRPARLHITAKRRDHAQTCHDDTAHVTLPN